MIINNKNAYFEYEFDLQPDEASLEAIDAYIEQVLGFEGRFTLSEAMWRAVRDAVDDISVSAVIELANAADSLYSGMKDKYKEVRGENNPKRSLE